MLFTERESESHLFISSVGSYGRAHNQGENQRANARGARGHAAPLAALLLLLVGLSKFILGLIGVYLDILDIGLNGI